MQIRDITSFLILTDTSTVPTGDTSNGATPIQWKLQIPPGYKKLGDLLFDDPVYNPKY